jgi:hypothetical protein
MSTTKPTPDPDKARKTSKTTRPDDDVPAVRSFLLLHEPDENGTKFPKLLSEGDEVEGTVTRKMHRGRVNIDAIIELEEDGSCKGLYYRLYDNRNNMVASGRMQKPGKYRFWVEHRLDKDGNKTGGYAGRMEFEDLDYLRSKNRQLKLCDRGSPHAWNEIEVLEIEEGAHAVAVRFFDNSYIDAAGKLIESYRRDGELKEAPKVCMARRWAGRPLMGNWRIGKYTPKPLERLLSYLGALHDGHDRFPLFEKHPELATVVRMQGSSTEFEILGPPPTK